MARKRHGFRTVQPSKPVALDDREKQAIVAACEAFIRDVLKPRFLPEIKPTQFNYVVDIRSSWAGGRYRFIQRYRSGHPDNLGQEFDAPFARIDRMAPDSFDVQWMTYGSMVAPLPGCNAHASNPTPGDGRKPPSALAQPKRTHP